MVSRAAAAHRRTATRTQGCRQHPRTESVQLLAVLATCVQLVDRVVMSSGRRDDHGSSSEEKGSSRQRNDRILSGGRSASGMRIPAATRSSSVIASYFG